VIVSAVIAGLIASGAYLFGRPLEASIAYGFVLFLVFSFNMARAEVEELKLILEQEAPGWRERNADWTSTWDWNRMIKRKQRKQRRLVS
jgi:hypothetical protein